MKNFQKEILKQTRKHTKIAPRLGFGIGLGLVLELGGNFPRGQLSQNLLNIQKFFLKKFKNFLKKYHDQNQPFKRKDDFEKSTKEVIGKRNVISEFPNKLVINDIEITDKILIADRSNKPYGIIGPELASRIS